MGQHANGNRKLASMDVKDDGKECTTPGCKSPNTHTTDKCYLTRTCYFCQEVGHIASRCPVAKATSMAAMSCEYLGEDEDDYEGP